MAEITKETTFFNRMLKEIEQKENQNGSLLHLRDKAKRALLNQQLPTSRNEEWKYCSLKSLEKEQFVLSSPSALTELSVDPMEYMYPEAAHHHLTFVNGHFREDLSKTDRLPEGVKVANISDVLKGKDPVALQHFGKYALWEEDPFVPFNTVAFRDGAYIYLPPSVKIEQPVQLLFLNTEEKAPYFMAPRCLIVGDQNSEMTVVEDHIGISDNLYFNAPVTEIRLAENSNMTHVKLQRESKKAYHISRLAAWIGKNSNYKSYAVHLGSKLSRSDVKAVLKDENTHATLDGLVMINEGQLSDTHSIMDHTSPHCTSHQLHKCIIDDTAVSVFNGKIFVRQDAQKTDAFQENRNLQLSNTGTAFSKPQLEIFADDVSCSHGATIGQLDADQAFYLKTRGLTEGQTREILTLGFALDVIDSIPVDSVQQRLKKEIEAFTRKSKSITNTTS